MSDTILSTENLSRRFGRKQALQNVRLTAKRGCVLGLVGENGAGKTTLIKHLLGLLKAQQGQVRVFGLNPVSDPVGVLGRIGYLSENRELPDWMRIEQLLHYSQAFYPRWDRDFAESLRQTFELQSNQRIASLSRGQRARAGLLVALAHRPELLILDEPSSGLDPVVRRDILSAIIRTVADEGRTVLFSSHLLEEVGQVADEIVMLYGGRVALSGSAAELLESHRRWVVRFAEPLEAPPQQPAILHSAGEGREWTIWCAENAEQLAGQIRRDGGEILERAPASLDEIFLARVRSARRATDTGAQEKEAI